MNRAALVIGTDVALNGLESGAYLRVKEVSRILENQGFSIYYCKRSEADSYLARKWDAIALVSYSTAMLARKARNATSFLWFDATDSWSRTRLSQIRQGRYSQIAALFRDIFFLVTAPHLDLITFISKRDRNSERFWWKWRSVPYVFPILELDREISLKSGGRIVFVGDGNYFPNKKALGYLEELVVNLAPETIIDVYGKGFQSTSPNFRLHGYKQAEVIYRQGDLYLAPIFSGAGLKLKVAIPVWNGLRVVTTPEGANGFKKSDLIVVAKSKIEFAEKIKEFQNIPQDYLNVKPREQIFELDETQQIKERISKLTLD